VDPRPPRRHRSRHRRLIAIRLGIAVVVATFLFVLPRIADYRQVWGVVKQLSWKQIAALAGAATLNLVTFAPPWMVALPGLDFRRAFVLTQASTASTYIAPGGAAVGVGLAYVILRGWGFGGTSVTLAVALTGIWNQLALLGFPPLALALLTLQQEQNALLQTVALIGLAVFVVAVAAFAAALATPNLAHFVGKEAARLVN
jgi:putative heme transporter